MKVCDCDASAIPANVLLLLCFEFVCLVKPPLERNFSLQTEQEKAMENEIQG
jgi:hypothetical protein